MKKALIDGARICQLSAETFPVAKPLQWVDVPDETTERDKYIDGAVVAHVQPPASQIDHGDMDALQKQMKAVLLCVAQVGGLTNAQIKTMFKNKMDALP